MRDSELLRLDHERNAARLREFGEIRFRLLAFVPTIAGATVAILPQRAEPEDFAAVGLVGLVATLGVYLYELRNTALLRDASARVLLLERGLDPDEGAPAPPPAETPAGPRLFGLVRPTHARGLALIYGATLGSWIYLAVWGALGALEVPGADGIGAIVGLLGAVAVIADAERFS
jgi:hypothetical protein